MEKIAHLINYAGNGGSEKYIKVLGGDFLIYNIEGDLIKEIKNSKFKIHQIKMRNPLDLKAAFQLAKFCKKNHIKIIHTHFARENYIAIISKIFGSKVKVVYTSHINLKNNKIWKFMNKCLTKHNHTVIAVCNSVKELLIENGYPKEKIKVIYNGANLSEKQTSDDFISQNKPCIVTLARLSKEKGLFFLLDIAKQMPEKHFIIAGDGPLLEKLINKAPENVSFPGFSKSKDILEKAALYINTSKSEALSFGILEALGFGVPIIATNIGGNIDIIKESSAGRLIQYGNVKEAKEKINEVLENRKFYSESAIKAIKTTFSEKTMKERTYEIYL